MSKCREWTLLLTGEHNGLVGEANYKFSGSPDYYERVDVVEKQRIAELEKENERLGKSWIAMEKRERATDKAIDELREEANELVSALRGEVSALENIINSIIEVYAGMEGFEPQTAPEAYCLRIIEQMYKAALEGERDE